MTRFAGKKHRGGSTAIRGKKRQKKLDDPMNTTLETAPSTAIAAASSGDVTSSPPITPGNATTEFFDNPTFTTLSQSDDQMVDLSENDEPMSTGLIIDSTAAGREATGAVRASPKPIDFSQIPEHVGNTQPEDIDQLTRWVWKQAASSGSNNITMLQAKFKPINKLRMREKARHGVYGPVTLNISSRHHLEGAIIQIIGKPQVKACLRCKSENGPFHLCTSVSGHQGGSCGNCVTGGNASKCSLRPTTFAHGTPRAVKNRIIAALKDPRKQMKKGDRIRTLATLTEKQVMAVAQTFIQAVSEAGGPAESTSELDDSEESEEMYDSE